MDADESRKRLDAPRLVGGKVIAARPSCTTQLLVFDLMTYSEES